MSIKPIYRKLKVRIRLYCKINWFKSLYFNFKYFPPAIACKLPVLFYGKVHFGTLKGSITLPQKVHMGMIGFGQPYELVTRARGIAQIHIEGRLVFEGYVQFGLDYLLHLGPDAALTMGHMSSVASNSKVICHQEIKFGNYARLGSETQVIDTNFHAMHQVSSGTPMSMRGAISIGNYNFVSNRVTLLQGAKTPDHCTLASNSLCTKDITTWGTHILVGGIPVKLLREDIDRDWDGEHEMLDKYLKLY